MANLYIIPRTQSDATAIAVAIEASPFWAEWDAREGFFTMEEEGDCMDALEHEVQAILDGAGLDARLEFDMDN